MQLIADRSSRRLLRVHIIGYQTSSSIQPLTQAMSFELVASQMAHD
ncbi:hypothetical protein [Mycobacterium uberis]